jgi:hypothetical protein
MYLSRRLGFIVAEQGARPGFVVVGGWCTPPPDRYLATGSPAARRNMFNELPAPTLITKGLEFITK